jgi:hypothetical protein
MEKKMNKKILFVLLLSALMLASCDAIPDLGIGGESVEEEMELQEIKPEPTEAVLPESVFYRDELDGDPNEDWGMRVLWGLEEQLIWSQMDGKLRFRTLPPNDTNFVFLNKNNNYEDVIVQAEVENFGPQRQAFSLICRASEYGWYEMRISGSGYYELLRFDQYRKDEGSKAYINLLDKRYNSTLINGAVDKNTFALSCIGSTISGFINGEQLYYKKRPLGIEEDTYREGTIGFGVLGYGKELDMTFNWIEAKKP